jgi:photosystem II stability/assembly factor-like uncharacterized protein
MKSKTTRLRGWRWALGAALPIVAAAALIFANVHGPVTHAAAGSQHDVGDESAELVQSLVEYFGQRAAPADQAPAAAWPAAVSYAKTVKASSTTAWTEIGPKNYQTDDPNYADPNFSNAGAGAGYASGRITALAALRDGKTVFAGGADGGVWKSTDAGQHWTPLFDSQDTLAIGTITIDEAKGGYTVYVGTGEANTSADGYAGVGILKSTDGGATWSRMGGDELVGALISRIVVDPTDHSRLYAATSHGLYRWTSGATSWQRILGSGSNPVANFVSDVALRPGTGGATGDIVAVIGWRDGAATNGLYESKDGGNTFSGAYNPQGYVSPKSQGRVSLSYAADGSKLYAVVQDPSLFNVPGAKTNLEGVYVSRNGDPQGPFNQVANSSNLANTGSAMKPNAIGKGYQPGVQTWYDQFIQVDPANPNHVYLGLEEVYETTDGGVSWTTLGPYWNFPFSCWSSNPLGGTCPNTTHSDQHAITIANGTVWVGNDGGVWSRPLSVHTNVNGSWTNMNRTLGTLQFYYAGAGQAPNGPLTIYGGLQDNGTAKVIPGQLATEPFGGDGGDTQVDPTNPDNVITEYTDLAMAASNDGGHSWRSIAPNDPNPRFIAPFSMDPTNTQHFVAGGQFVYDSTKGFNTVCNGTTCDWQVVYNQGTGHTTTAIAAVGSMTYAAWCGPCNPSFSTGTGFASGIATNYGGAWHQLTPPLTSRYVSSLTVDPANPAHAYAVYSGYSRHWIISPFDPGVGHVFETTDGGATWANISGDLVDAPADDLVIVNGHLVVATDIGVYVSGIHGGAWLRLGAGLPNTPVNDLTVAPRGDLIIAATHGRGLWSIPTSAISA